MPTFHDFLTWLEYLHKLPQAYALAVLAVSLSALIFGLRWERYYACIGAAALGWFAGCALAKLMYVEAWYVGVPVAILATISMWQVSSLVLSTLAGAAVGAGTGVIAYRVHGSPLAVWLSGAAGFMLGWALRVAARRFVTALLIGVIGVVHVIATLGAAVHASHGWFAPGAYRDTPLPFIIAGTVLLLVSIIVQVMLEPESSAASKSYKLK